MFVSHIRSKQLLLLTRFQEKVTTTINWLLEGCYSLRRKRVEIPFIWLITGALLIFAIVLSVPAELDYGGVGPRYTSPFIMLNLSQISGLWGHSSVISFSSAQRTICSLLKATLRSLFTALGAISMWIRQLTDEESAIPTSVTGIQGATLIDSVAAVATTVTNRPSILPTSIPRVEALNQPEPMPLVVHDTHDYTHTEVQVVIDHIATEIPHPYEE